MSDLEAFSPEKKSITIRGQEIFLGPLTVRQIPVMLKAFSVLKEKASSSAGVERSDWMGLLADHSDKIIEAVAVASGQRQEWVSDLYLDEMILLAEAVWEVNQDFFVGRVLPTLTRALDGATPSQSSSAPVTH